MKKYDAYKPSGVEWLGEVPKHWEVKRLKFLVKSIRGGGTPSTNNPEFWDGPLPWVSPKDMKADRITKTEDYVTTLAVASSSTELVAPNSVLLVVRSGILKHTLPVAINTVEVTLNQDMKALTPMPEILPNYLALLLKGMQSEVLNFCTKISATVDSIEMDDLVNFPLSLPPLPEQHAIAAFLDARTAHLDGLIARKEALLTLLAEQRAARITRAVTRGLVPDVPLKASGVPWLGQVPAHWEVKRLKFVTSKTGSGKTPKGGADVYVSAGVTFLRSQNIHFDGLELSDVAFIEPTVDEEMSSTRVRSGDVLLNITGASLGRVAMAGPELGPANVNQHVCILRPDSSEIDSVFLWKFLASPIGQSQIFQNEQGISRDALNFEQIANLAICVPPLTEQKQLVEHLAVVEKPLMELRKMIENHIAKLREYRAALITAAVTGRIDVRAAGASPQGTAAVTGA